jgi:hypothetical protein
MDTIEPANRLLKQHMRALAAIVAEGEISDPFHLQRTLNGIHRTLQNDGMTASGRVGMGSTLDATVLIVTYQVNISCSSFSPWLLQSLKLLTTLLDMDLYSLLRKVYGLMNLALDVIRADVRAHPSKVGCKTHIIRCFENVTQKGTSSQL